jgi:diguanylate cyclase (GGDEF)-like protein
MSSPSSQPILRAHAVFAIGLACLVVAVALAVLPFANTPLSPQPFVFPIAYTTVLVCSTLTIFLLLLEFGAARKDGIVLLISAYVLLSVTSLLQLLAMLNLSHLIGIAGTQPMRWLWVCFHGGFPLLAGLARIVPNSEDRLTRIFGRTAGVFGLPLLLISTLVFVLTRCSSSLPSLGIGNARTPLFDTILLGLCGEALCILAMVFRAGLRDRLDMWVCVTLLVFLVDDTLSTATRARYTVGWIGAASVATLSSAILLCTLLWEVRALYKTLITHNADLQHQAFRDGLTGVFSRRHFDQTFPRTLKDSLAVCQPLCLMLVDADHFKVCNDHYGHQAGDRLLVQLAQTLSAAVARPDQFVARYGGEEFVAVMPGVEPSQAVVIAESLRFAVEEKFSVIGDGGAGGLTVSIGVACLPATSESVDPAVLLHVADQALYAAKRAGRNCVRVSPVDLQSDTQRDIGILATPPDR